jgi:hypothetical protein
MKVILLGPQRRPTLAAVARSMRLEGRIATVTAGWQEREPDDGELSELLGTQDTNLSLYRRWLDVQERDPEYAAAQRRLRDVLDELQDIYLLRLDYALQAVYAVQRRSGQGGRGQGGRGQGGSGQVRDGAVAGGLDGAVAEAIAGVRELDDAHLRRIGAERGEFYQAWPPHDRPVIAEHRAEVTRLLSDAAALVVAGGHVGVLADVLHLFNVAAALRSPVIAWSAGAMALAERIILFYDRAPQGPGHPEVFGPGLGVLRQVVPLPHARARMLLDDAPRMAVFARRFAPARCVLLETGTRIDADSEGSCPPEGRVLTEDGSVTALEAA